MFVVDYELFIKLLASSHVRSTSDEAFLFIYFEFNIIFQFEFMVLVRLLWMRFLRN